MLRKAFFLLLPTRTGSDTLFLSYFFMLQVAGRARESSDQVACLSIHHLEVGMSSLPGLYAMKKPVLLCCPGGAAAAVAGGRVWPAEHAGPLGRQRRGRPRGLRRRWPIRCLGSASGRRSPSFRAQYLILIEDLIEAFPCIVGRRTGSVG